MPPLFAQLTPEAAERFMALGTAGDCRLGVELLTLLGVSSPSAVVECGSFESGLLKIVGITTEERHAILTLCADGKISHRDMGLIAISEEMPRSGPTLADADA